MRIGGRPPAGDPASGNIEVGAAVGVLGIELETRRRNRMNGVVTAADDAGFTVAVRQSFGNCPKYIQARRATLLPAAAAPAARPEGALLSPEAAALVRQADTFFIATPTPGEGGVDVSHRGGQPGFVRVSEEAGATVLTAPDFAGNMFFMTLGNILMEPRAGLLFVDFAAGHLLFLTGAAEVVWEGPELVAFAGAERLLRLRVEAGVFLRDALPIRWSAAEAAPQLAVTGTWAEAAPGGRLAGVAVGETGL
jgi:predicted pyridoxine 5'-phosphate oxidase superfamily flavin-nucleotide-binding protein